MEWESNFLDITERYQEHGDHILHSQRHPQSLSGGLQGRTASVSRAGQCDGNVAGEIQFIRLSLAPSGHQVRKCACVFGVVRKVGESGMWWVAVPFPMCCHDWQVPWNAHWQTLDTHANSRPGHSGGGKSSTRAFIFSFFKFLFQWIYNLYFVSSSKNLFSIYKVT